MLLHSITTLAAGVGRGVSTQSALNLVFELGPEGEAAARSCLARMRQSANSNPFHNLSGVHFARLLVIPAANRRLGRRFPAKLVLTTNYDGEDEQRHLGSLVEAAAEPLHELLSCCAGYAGEGDRGALLAYMRRHRKRVGAFYINTIGRDVSQVAFEAKLVRALQVFLDGRDWQGRSPLEVRQALIDFVAGHEDLKAALTPAPEISLLERLLGYARVAAIAVIGLAIAIAALPLTILLVIVLRIHEVANVPENLRPRDDHIRELENDEDLGAQNQLSAVGTLQRSPFRALLLRTGLFLLQIGARHVFYRGKLAEVDTIHFARWVLMDGGARLYFLSNYDGSPESYQDDFIERVAFGLNLVFSNGQGWPRTRYLLFGGASDELAFKAYYRSRQIPTQLWYVAPAYRDLTAVNAAHNAEIRKGLCTPMSSAQCREWLLRF